MNTTFPSHNTFNGQNPTDFGRESMQLFDMPQTQSLAQTSFGQRNVFQQMNNLDGTEVQWNGYDALGETPSTTIPKSPQVANLA